MERILELCSKVVRSAKLRGYLVVKLFCLNPVFELYSCTIHRSKFEGLRIDPAFRLKRSKGRNAGPETNRRNSSGFNFAAGMGRTENLADAEKVLEDRLNLGGK